MFRLIRHYSIASFFALLVVTILLGFLYRQTAIEELVAQEESKNVAVTQVLANLLRPQILASLAATTGLSGGELRAHPALDALRSSINAEIAGVPVAKIKLYSREGVTIFSTDEAQIGEDNQANEGFRVGLAGGIVSELTHRDNFSGFDGVLEDQDVISTYLPVRFGGAQGSIEGVFELYSNVTPLLHRINATQRTIVLGVCSILALLYVALFFVVRHADGIIRRQQAEQIEAEQQLLRQQRSLAVLRERERLARDLHDSVGQVLAYLSVQAQAVSAHWERGNLEEARRLLLRLVEVVQLSHLDVRKQIQALQASPAGEMAGAAEAARPSAPVLPGPGDAQADVPPGPSWAGLAAERAAESQLLRIVQEALTNIRKHAQAKHAWVLVDVGDRQAVVTIADDGLGFAADQVDQADGWHFGLQMMRARAAEIGATLDVQSAPGEGTRVTVRAPLPPAAATEEGRA